ncbi:alpha/beta hydrolase family protein [Tautonia plasticadhaerens]|uniref:Alpha/beta hydrolase family protein n=1 Tax=Tautonia plasticadhaerens TaxID=2527974 RepID=A0A518GX83_9BACT|nr:alpha/beta hydrolase [Tautonia plasticadhaerens]QDV33195.1 Alpha/beta hydrolase family protein [Tautonia plasticadhaerens]
MTRVLYLHGLHSRPGGVKPTFLRSIGVEVINPHLPDEDFPESVRRAREAFEAESPDVVVGSSRGGAVALAVPTGEVPVVLIAPAWRRWGDQDDVRATDRTVLLHSERDEVIAIEDSRELVRRSGLPAESLVVVGVDHNMTDPEALDALRWAVERIRRTSD